MIRYASRLPPGRGCQILEDNQTVRKTVQCSEEYTLLFMEALVNHFIRQPDPLVVPVYRFEVLEKSRYKYCYSYDMQLLGMLSEEEKQFVDRVGDLYDKHGADALSIPYELYPEKRSLPQFFSYLKQVVELDRYHDLHSGNIMIDLDENYRIIDLEGFHYYTLNNSANDWITR